MDVEVDAAAHVNSAELAASVDAAGPKLYVFDEAARCLVEAFNLKETDTDVRELRRRVMWWTTPMASCCGRGLRVCPNRWLGDPRGWRGQLAEETLAYKWCAWIYGYESF